MLIKEKYLTVTIIWSIEDWAAWPVGAYAYDCMMAYT